MEQSAQWTARESGLKIFVGGAPANVEDAVVYSYFQQFGAIKWVKAYLKGNRRHLATGKGCFIVQTWDSHTYDSILACQKHALCGRILQCWPYLSGSQLKKDTMDKNNRRVILKNVAKEIPENELRYFIETHIGALDCMYAFKSEELKPSHDLLRKFRTYSLMFKNQKSANYLVLQGQLVYKDWPVIIVEKFNRTKLDNRVYHHKKQYSHHKVEQMQKGSGQIKRSRIERVESESRHETRRGHRSLGNSLAKPAFELEKREQQSTRRRSAGAQVDWHRLSDLMLFSYEAHHDKKPGSKCYHWTHSCLNLYADRFADWHPPLAGPYRLNISK